MFEKAFSVKGHDDDHLLSQNFSDIDRPKNWKSSGKDEKGREQYIAIRRILTPVSAQSRIYIPWQRANDNDPKGTMVYLPKDKNNSFVIPEVLRMAAKADLEVKASLRYDMAKTRSVFSPVNIFMYLVFCKDAEDDKKDTIFVAEYTKQLAQGIHSVGHKEHPKFKVKYHGEEVPALMHGPVLLYDLFLTKLVDKKKDIRYGTSYEVEPDIDNKYSGKIPTNVYKYGYPENMKWNTVFTEGEQAAIEKYLTENSSKDLLSVLEKKANGLVTNETDVLQAISRFEANATDPSGAPLLPDVDKFLKSFNTLSGINLLGTSVQVAGQIGAAKEEFDDTADIIEGDFEKSEGIDASDDAFFEDAESVEELGTKTAENPFLSEDKEEKEDDPFV